MKHAEAKRAYLYAHQGGRCAQSGEPLRNDFELHHALCKDGKHSHAVYPLLVDSIINLRAMNRGAHERHRSFHRASHQRCARWEAFLERHPAIAEWVNAPGDI